MAAVDCGCQSDDGGGGECREVASLQGVFASSQRFEEQQKVSARGGMRINRRAKESRRLLWMAAREQSSVSCASLVAVTVVAIPLDSGLLHRGRLGCKRRVGCARVRHDKLLCLHQRCQVGCLRVVCYLEDNRRCPEHLCCGQHDTQKE